MYRLELELWSYILFDNALSLGVCGVSVGVGVMELHSV